MHATCGTQAYSYPCTAEHLGPRPPGEGGVLAVLSGPRHHIDPAKRASSGGPWDDRMPGRRHTATDGPAHAHAHTSCHDTQASNAFGPCEKGSAVFPPVGTVLYLADYGVASHTRATFPGAGCWPATCATPTTFSGAGLSPSEWHARESQERSPPPAGWTSRLTRRPLWS